MIRVILVGLSLLASGCAREQSYPRRPITLVCPWGAGGGTDRVSRQLAVHLEQELGVAVNVINATGGKGVTGHSRSLYARPDGYTLGMITLELNMMHWSGLTDLTYQDCLPLMSVNEDYAALLVRGDAPWQELSELQEEIRAAPGQLKASGTAAGGAWHLALAGWLMTENLPADAVVWVSSTGAGPSLLDLMSTSNRGLDLVCCSLPEARAQLESGEVRALGVMAPERVKGFESVPTFAEQGSSWTLGGWRGLALPLDTPAERVAILETALHRIVTGQTRVGRGLEDSPDGQTFPEFMDAQGFDRTWRDAAGFREFLADNDAKFGELLTSDALASVGQDPMPRMAFPTVLGSGLGLLLLLALLGHLRGSRGEKALDQGSRERLSPPAQAVGMTSRGLATGGAVVASMVLYWLAAETVGFVLAAGLMLLILLVAFGARWRQAVAVVVVAVPLTYQLFAHGLRVPLPQGWLGW